MTDLRTPVAVSLENFFRIFSNFSLSSAAVGLGCNGGSFQAELFFLNEDIYYQEKVFNLLLIPVAAIPPDKFTRINHKRSMASP
jgi:hypothetical protein